MQFCMLLDVQDNHSLASDGLVLSMLLEPSISSSKAFIRYFLPISVFFVTFDRCAFFLAYNWQSVILPPCVSIPSYKSLCMIRSFSLNDKSSRLPFGVLSVGNNFQAYTCFVLPNASQRFLWIETLNLFFYRLF